MKEIFLGVNIDHVATLRQARATNYPNLVVAALVAESSGADSITIHLREDRRHIQDADIYQLALKLNTKMNLEMAVIPEMLAIASKLQPADCCLVPEKRQELTTEGGLDIIKQQNKISDAIAQLQQHNIRVSPFIDADCAQITAAFEAGAKIIEIHTGHYADAVDANSQVIELAKIIHAAKFGASLGLQINAGHGLHYENVQKIAAIPEFIELNIGHSIIAKAVFTGLATAVQQMKQLILNARKLHKNNL